jgi:replication factor A1
MFVSKTAQLVLSDGTRHFSGMSATQLNPLIHSGEITVNTIIKITHFIVNSMGSGQRVCIVMACDVVGPHPNRIGDPKDVTKVGAVEGGAPQNTRGAQPMYGNVQSGNNNQGGGNPYTSSSNPYGNNNRNQNNPQNSSPIVRTSANGQHVTPISGLNMYSNRWVIRAKVTNKGEKKQWQNAKGEGSLFSITLQDSSGHDIRCTFFKEAVDKFYDMLEEGKVYNFSGGRLKVANMQWNNCKSQFEITFDQNSEIHLDDDGGDIMESYEFKKIGELENTEPNAYVDVLAVVKHVGDVNTFVSKKSGKEMTKCELTLEDDSGCDVKLTLWGDKAHAAAGTYANCPVVAFKKCRVGDFGGRCLGDGTPSVNPNIPEANQLSNWWAMNGNKTQTRSLSSAGGGGSNRDTFESRKEIRAIKDEHLGTNDKPDYLTFKATFSFLRKEKQGGDDTGGMWYTACANSEDPCKNMFKATQTSDGNWHCDKCQQTHDHCVRRFVLSGTVMDESSTTWVSIFNNEAQDMFGVTADYLYNIMNENGDRDPYNSAFAKSTYTDWIMTCKVKQDVVGDETRTKTSVFRMSPVDYAKESREILNALAAF